MKTLVQRKNQKEKLSQLGSKTMSSLENPKDHEIQKLLKQQERWERYQHLPSSGNQKISNLSLFSNIENIIGAKYCLGGGNKRSLDCSSFVSCGQGLVPFGKGRETVVSLSRKVRLHDSPQTLQPGDVVIWKSSSSGNHIEYVAEPPRYDSKTQSWLIKTLGSAKSTQAFNATGTQLVTEKKLPIRKGRNTGYGAGYRVREFSQRKGKYYKEGQKKSSSSFQVTFASFIKKPLISPNLASKA